MYTTIEICLGIITVAFVTLVVFLIIFLNRSKDTVKETKKTMVSTRKDIEEFTEEGRKMAKHIDELARDIKGKAKSLDFLFDPLKELNKEEKEVELSSQESIVEILECIASGVVLYQKLKKGFKRHVKIK